MCQGLVFFSTRHTLLSILADMPADLAAWGLCIPAGDFVAPQIQAVLLAGVCGAVGVFAARKYTQPAKDDLGDKSIFE